MDISDLKVDHDAELQEIYDNLDKPEVWQRGAPEAPAPAPAPTPTPAPAQLDDSVIDPALLAIDAAARPDAAADPSASAGAGAGAGDVDLTDAPAQDPAALTFEEFAAAAGIDINNFDYNDVDVNNFDFSLSTTGFDPNFDYSNTWDPSAFDPNFGIGPDGQFQTFPSYQFGQTTAAPNFLFQEREAALEERNEARRQCEEHKVQHEAAVAKLGEMEKAHEESRNSMMQELQELQSRTSQMRDEYQQSINTIESQKQELRQDLEGKLLAKQNEYNELKTQFDINDSELKTVQNNLHEERSHNSQTANDDQQKIAQLTAQKEHHEKVERAQQQQLKVLEEQLEQKNAEYAELQKSSQDEQEALKLHTRTASHKEASKINELSGKLERTNAAYEEMARKLEQTNAEFAEYKKKSQAELEHEKERGRTAMHAHVRKVGEMMDKHSEGRKTMVKKVDELTKENTQAQQALRQSEKKVQQMRDSPLSSKASQQAKSVEEDLARERERSSRLEKDLYESRRRATDARRELDELRGTAERIRPFSAAHRREQAREEAEQETKLALEKAKDNLRLEKERSKSEKTRLEEEMKRLLAKQEDMERQKAEKEAEEEAEKNKPAATMADAQTQTSASVKKETGTTPTGAVVKDGKPLPWSFVVLLVLFFGVLVFCGVPLVDISTSGTRHFLANLPALAGRQELVSRALSASPRVW